MSLYDRPKTWNCLLEQRLGENFGHDHEAGKVHILSRNLDKFTPDVEFDIEIYLRVVIGRFKKFQIVLVDGGDGFVSGF